MLEPYRLLTDAETKIWEAADRGTDDSNEEWCELRRKLKAEMEQEQAGELADRLCTCPTCGERCIRMQWRTFGVADAKWLSRCCLAMLPLQ